MKSIDRRAQVLDACLEQMRAHGLPADVALASCPVTDDGLLPLAEAEFIMALAGLAGDLQATSPAPAPEASFVAALAERLAAAPAPSRLAPSVADTEALDDALRAAARSEASPLAERQAAQGFAERSEFSERADFTALIELAADLGRLPAVPAPSAGYLDGLAAALATAPEPRSLAHLNKLDMAAADLLRAEDSETLTSASHSTTVMVHALDSGLDTLNRFGLGRAIDAAPEMSGELAPLLALAGALVELPAPPRPTEDFRQALLGHLAEAPLPSSIQRRRDEAAGMGFLRKLWRSTAFTAAAAATVIMFMAAGVTYASANALPGEPLYPVKRVAEHARIWLTQGDGRLALHLSLADARLQEALAVTDSSGLRLAEFNASVTSALVVTDEAIAAGRPRESLVEPLLGWLIDARGRLIAGRTHLPPMAWRASVALIDEAIQALRSGRPLSIAPVHRLIDLDGGLLVAAVMPGARHLLLPAPQPVQDPRDGSPIARGSGASLPQPSLPVEPGHPAQAPPSIAEVPPPAHSAGTDPDEKPEHPANSIEGRDRVVVRATNAPPPTLAALVLPTFTAAPPSATPLPTVEPSPSPMPVLAPEIEKVSCSPKVIEEAGESLCEVILASPADPQGGWLSFEWSVLKLQGELKTPDQPKSIFEAYRLPSGMLTSARVVISVVVTDGNGDSAYGETTVTVKATGQSQSQAQR